MPVELVSRIVAEHERGTSRAAIARALNAEGVETAQGGKRWHHTTVGVVLAYAELDACREEWERAEDLRKWAAGARRDAGRASGWRGGHSNQCAGCKTFKSDVGGVCRECGYLPGAGYVSVPASVSYLAR